MRYGAGAALYDTQPDTASFSRRRQADDPAAIDSSEHLTAEQLFACDPSSYGPFPTDDSAEHGAAVAAVGHTRP